jgi:protein AFG1
LAFSVTLQGLHAPEFCLVPFQIMYEHRARFMCSAEGSPKELFDKVVTRADAPRKTDTRSTRVEDADLLVDDELGFAKDRAMSRSES